MGIPSMENLVAVPSLETGQGKALPFDVYVRLPWSNKISLYRRRGSHLEQQRIDQDKNNRHLNFFVEQADYERYLEYVADQLFDLIVSHPLDRDRLRRAAGRVLSNAVAQEAPAQAKQLMDNLGDVVTRFVSRMANEELSSRQALFMKFARLAEMGTDFQRHPSHVSSLAVMLALGLGVSDQRTLVETALAGLLHDIGLTQLPVSVIAEAHSFQNAGTVSKALLKLHPQGGLDLLWNRGVKVSQLMESMILQHHEEWGGGGYPRGLSGEAVHPFAQLLRLADDLDDLIGNEEGPESLEAKVIRLFEQYEKEQVLEPVLRESTRLLLF